jgi:hypothetical protein
MESSNLWSKLATVFYVIWGLLHFQAAYFVYLLGTTVTPSMTQGRLFQGAWNLLFFAISAIAVAITLNWRNTKVGYVANLAIVSVTDVGFILFVLVPGYMALWPGLLGPVFWLLGLACSTMALRTASMLDLRPTRL